MSETKDSSNESSFCKGSTKRERNNYFRLFLLVIVFAAVIYLIVRNVNVFGNVLLVLLGFGAVVLVHEFGHFIVAKLCGIKVEAFSIGFPPVLAGVKRTEKGYRIRVLPGFFCAKEASASPDASRGCGDENEHDDSLFSFTIGKKARPGETEYRIGLIPFGGFVKMLGQEDTGPVKTSNDPRSYANKPVGVRMAVITAGVVFNAISAVIIFMVVFLVGIKLLPAVVGGVVPNSPASLAGLKAGDEIIEIEGKNDNLDFGNVLMAAALSGRDKEVKMKVKHSDGSIEDFSIAAEQMAGEQIRGFGILSAQSLVITELRGVDANDLYVRTGLKPGDVIKSVNGKDVRSHWELDGIVRNAFVPVVTVLAERTEPVSKKLERVKGQIRLDLRFADTYRIEPESELYHIYSLVPRLRIRAVFAKSLSVKEKLVSVLNKIGIGKKIADSMPVLQKGDIILAVGDVENPTYKEMRDVTTEYEDKELPIRILRRGTDGPEKPLTVTVVPKRIKDSERVVIGVDVVLDAAHPVVARSIVTKGGSAAPAIPRGAVIEAVDGVEVSNFYDIIREIRRNAGQRITIDWRIDEETAGSVGLDVGDDKEFINVKSAFAEPVPFRPLERLYQVAGPIDAIVIGYKKTIMFIAQAYVTLQRIIGGLVSPSNLMGPVGILTLSYRVVAERPLVYYAYLLGLISAFIAVFNFLPMLPFDGGHILFLLVEKIKGSAVSEKVQGAVTYVGLALVGMLFLYVTFNDIVRSCFS